VNHAICRFILLATSVLTLAAAPPPKHKTENIIFVMTDGLRLQEMFTGAEESLITKENGAVANVDALKKAYWRDTPAARREALMPFMWSVVAKNGQIYGNRTIGSEAYVTNGKNFSYPGYSEALCGFADPSIDSNDKIPNGNVTVLEWLHKKPAYRGKVAAFGAWDVFSWIFNAERAGFPVNAGWNPFTAMPSNPRLALLNQLKAETPRVWAEEPFDALPFHTALEYLKERKPRVLYLSLGETDDWAHGGNYADYLHAAHRADAYLKVLWDTMQSIPQYRNKTTFIFSTDHGRGESPVEWKSHGVKIPHSKYIWMAFLGPDTRALGERSSIPAVTQSQIAATLAALLGEDYGRDVQKAGKPLPDVLPQ
jgi:hypothetical protein